MGKSEEGMNSAPSQQMPTMASTTQAIEDGSKKIRKPYTITKSRENWTEQEHDKFLEALQLFDRDWKKIEAYVGTKTVIQIRSHAQKYFIKVQKNGTGEHVPPPRPKRKSSQPYPQKATAKTGTPAAEPSPVPVIEPNFVHSNQNATFGSANVESSGNSMPEWLHHSVHPPGALSYPPRGVNEEPIKNENLKKSEGLPSTSTTSNPSNPRTGNLRATPNFAEVYKFIGGVFDPSCKGHLKKLKSMAPIDRETILLLIRNLTMNLSSPDFEEHRLFLTVYDGNLEVGVPNSTYVETRCHMAMTPSISSSSFSPLSSTVSALHNSSTEHSLSGWFNPHPVSC